MIYSQMKISDLLNNIHILQKWIDWVEDKYKIIINGKPMEINEFAL